MLESRVEKFVIGRKIASEAIHDYFHPRQKIHSPGIHKTRIDGLNEEKDFWESIGYLSVVAQTSIRHPVKMYELLKKRDE